MIMREAGDIETAIEAYGDVLYRICFTMLKRRSDAEDAVQDTFIRYMQSVRQFESEQHRRAWLITVAGNRCRDMLRFRFRHPTTELSEIRLAAPMAEETGILEALMEVPEKFRFVLILHYVEAYRVEDIARMIGKTSSAVKMRLKKGRILLEEIYRHGFLEG